MTVKIAEKKEETYTESEEEDYENELIIRMKWCADGSQTMDEIIEKLKDQITYIQSLKDDGWELARVMEDDYGFARLKTDDNQAEVITVE